MNGRATVVRAELALAAPAATAVLLAAIVLLDAVVAAVRHEPEVVEAAEHPRGRGGRHAEPLRHRRRGDRPVGVALEGEDRLGVILDRDRELCSSHCHKRDYGMPKPGFQEDDRHYTL